jgi:hypothetical protein
VAALVAVAGVHEPAAYGLALGLGSLLGAPNEVTALFAALALFRAPYTLGIGVVSQVTGYITALVA